MNIGKFIPRPVSFIQATPLLLMFCIPFMQAFFLKKDMAPANASLAAGLTLTKQTWCVQPAVSGIAGHMDVTFRLVMTNSGTEVLTDLQLEDDLSSQITAAALIGVANVAFGPSNAPAVAPNLNLSYDGDTDIQLLDGTSGQLNPGDVLAIDLTVELDPNQLTAYQAVTNQAEGSALDPLLAPVSVLSDAPAGAPGDTGGSTDGLLLFIPSLNIAAQPLDYDRKLDCAPNGTVEFTLQVIFENTGNVTLDLLTLEADLAGQLGTALVSTAGTPTIIASTATANPVLNLGFTGSGANTNFFDGVSGMLEQGQSVTVEVRLVMNSNEPGAPDPLTIQLDGTGRGLFADGSPLPGCDAGELIATDLSDGGSIPESDNASFVGDTGGHDDPLHVLLPNLGLAKQVLSYLPAVSQTPGNVDVRFRIEMENLGNVSLTNLSLSDPLSAQLGSAYVNLVQAPQIVASTATANPVLGAFTNQIFNGTSGQLDPGQRISVEFVAQMNPDAGSAYPLESQATSSAIGTGLNGNPLTIQQLSDAGSDPKGTNPGFPGDTGCNNDPLAVNLPGLMVAQEIAGVDYSTSGINGRFDIIVQVLVQNTGSVDLTNFSLIENLAAASQLGTSFVAVTGAPQIMPVGAHGTLANASISPTANPAYNGTNNLLLSSGQLLPGQIFIVQFRAEVYPKAVGAPAFPKLQAEATATGNGPNGSPVNVTDASDSGFEPQSTNFGRPGNSGSSDDPTPLGNCGTLMVNNAISCNNSMQVSVNQDCIAAISPTMILEGEFPHCSSDDLLPLGMYYEIFMVTTAFGVPVPDAVPATPNTFEIDGSYVGQVLTVKVKEVVNGNSCWGQITLEDKLGPIFTCPSPVLIDCQTNLNTVPPPVATDNCDPNPVVSFAGQQILDNDICDDGTYRVRRTYTAVDLHGNSAPTPCVFEIHLTRPGVTFPADVVWHCQQYGSHPNIVNPTTLNAAVTDSDLSDPDIDAAMGLSANILANTGSGVVGGTGGVCGYAISRSDQTTAACGNTFKITRTWTVIDWCTGNVITMGTNGNDNVQIIKIIDKVNPVITRPNFSVNADVPAVNFSQCRSQGLLLPPMSFSDVCQSNNNVSIQIITSLGEAIYIAADGRLGGYIPSPGLPLGSHPVTYTATDACGNSTTITVTVTVADTETPTAVCDELTEAVLTNDGTATVFAATFNDGSTDNCCINNFAVRRMTDPCDDGHDDTVFGPSVKFCCTDVANSPVMVVFRVYDCSGNFNDCMVEVNVSDKQPPMVLSCPANARMTCDVFDTNYETQLANLAGSPAAQNELFDVAFGVPSFGDNCNFSITKNISVSIDQCLEGAITRTWTAVDPGGLASQICSQTLSVDHVSDFVVEFAPDLTIECGETFPAFIEPEIFSETCEMVGMTYSDDTITVVTDACFKIERTWVIINWCVLGQFTDQEVTEVPENQLNLPFPACDLDLDGDCDNRTFRDSWTASAKPGAAQANTTTGPDTDLDSDPWDGYIRYKQSIKALDTVDPVITAGCGVLPDVCIGGPNCLGTVTLIPPTVTDCSPVVTITATHSFGTGSGFGPFTNVLPGNYPVIFTANDGCNNQSSCTAIVSVVDCGAPTFACKPGLIVDIEVGLPPMITVNASQLIDSSGDNCPGGLTFSFSPDVNDTDSTFLCHQQGDNTVEIWVTDASGNQDLCTTTITIQANMGQCPDDLFAEFGGVIDTENGQPVQGITVNLSGQLSASQMTPASGDFNFADIPVGTDLTVTPLLDEDPLNGVTTFDLVLISKHILGIQSISSPYKLIAADANNSGAVTTFDIVTIRKLVLHIDEHFPNNNSWRFVNKNHVFPNPANPWSPPFPEVISVNNIPASVLDADFVAIKIGDVNGSASPNLQDGGTDDRNTEGTFLLQSTNKRLQKGKEFTFDLTTEDLDVVGFQFTLEFDPRQLEFLELENALTDSRNFGFRYIGEGYLTVSWNGEMTPGLTVASLRFRALEDLEMGNALAVSSHYTIAEAYDQYDELLDVQLEFDLAPPPSTFELYQNVPNPFSNFTTISFSLPEPSMATLTITDVGGRIVQTVTGLYEDGYNEVQLERSALPRNGIFYYRLDTPTDTATKTMVFID